MRVAGLIGLGRKGVLQYSDHPPDVRKSQISQLKRDTKAVRPMAILVLQGKRWHWQHREAHHLQPPGAAAYPPGGLTFQGVEGGRPRLAAPPEGRPGVLAPPHHCRSPSPTREPC